MQNQAIQEPGATKDKENVLSVLSDLYFRSRDVLTRAQVSLEDAVILSEGIMHLRMLLTELERLESGLKKRGLAISSVIDLKERYLELEGMIKEKRNNLAGKKRRTT